MNSEQRKTMLARLADPEYRRAFAEALLNTSIAAQLKANREARGLSQNELGDACEMGQSRISTMENVNYGSWSIKTLKRLAEAFDVPLIVRFGTWDELLQMAANLSRENLEVQPFSAVIKALPTDPETTSYSVSARLVHFPNATLPTIRPGSVSLTATAVASGG